MSASPPAPTSAAPPALTVGFDLDMTLVDSRAGIVATMQATLAEYGREVPADDIYATVGLPLDTALGDWLTPTEVPGAVERYRSLYPSLGVPPTTLLPGAAESLAAVRAHGGQVVVVSAKIASAVQLVLAHVGLAVDEVVGDLFGAGKGVALLERAAAVYVGDHPGDVVAARAAGAAAVAVTTGPAPASDLEAADVLLPDLRGFPAWLDEHVLDRRLADLERRLRDVDSLLVAFSGGADSAFLLTAAVRALGPEAVAAATAVSPSLPRSELEAAAAVAADLGVRHLTPATDELARVGYRANNGDRCAFCKAELLDVLAPLAAQMGLAAVATGTNADDAVAGFRPGIAAAAERGAVTPLRDAGLTKAQVRAASRRWGLATADKPAAACLASRVAYGVEVSADRLARVARAEAAVRAVLAGAGIPVRDLRVRDLGERARVEVDRHLATAVAARADVREAVLGAGFADVEVDSLGFRSGSMNDLLADPERYR